MLIIYVYIQDLLKRATVIALNTKNRLPLPESVPK